MQTSLTKEEMAKVLVFLEGKLEVDGEFMEPADITELEGLIGKIKADVEAAG